eukprot:TRINITY_DN52107_c0_g1_i1.p1 TRINITY_DN52107_c0_g1~~TRINITY_DN52107_c0_g1_i1.p1  ORF type:complete len:180 (-),score=36.79 TRINITY_DN52107_c0_g1_i1:89-628(-)
MCIRDSINAEYMGMLLSTVLEEDPKSTKSMKTIKSRLESKLINLSILRPRRKSAELRLRAITEVVPDRGGDTSPREIPYLQAIEMVKINPQFLSIEELKRIKIFPLRGWRVNKKAKMVSLDHPAPPTENPLKLIVLVLVIFGAIIVIVSVILINISQVCLLYTSPSPRDLSTSRMPSSA